MLNRPKIVTAIPHNNYIIDIELSDKRHLTLDMTSFLAAPAYKKLSNVGFFLSLKHDYRLIYWDDMHDMHIDQILQFATQQEPSGKEEL